jgi:hypothetical protein
VALLGGTPFRQETKRKLTRLQARHTSAAEGMRSKGEENVHPFDVGRIGACLLMVRAQGVHCPHSFS